MQPYFCIMDLSKDFHQYEQNLNSLKLIVRSMIGPSFPLHLCSWDPLEKLCIQAYYALPD